MYDEGGGEFSEGAAAECLYFTPWRDQKNKHDYYEYDNNYQGEEKKIEKRKVRN